MSYFTQRGTTSTSCTIITSNVRAITTVRTRLGGELAYQITIPAYATTNDGDSEAGLNRTEETSSEHKNRRRNSRLAQPSRRSGTRRNNNGGPGGFRRPVGQAPPNHADPDG